MKFLDLTGQTFGRLIVLERVYDHKNKGVYWLCLCECGNKKIIVSSSLKKGATKSCGCYNKEVASKNHKKLVNTYDLSGEYGIGYTLKGQEFYFDLEDYDKIKDYCWGRKYNYMRYLKRLDNNKVLNIGMHNLIIGLEPNKKCVVDHINGIPYDNRKSNLRVISQLNNMKNQKLRLNNKSGIKGVHFNKSNNKWCARININNKRIILGYYNNIDDAIKERKNAEKKYYGSFSRKEQDLANGSR